MKRHWAHCESVLIIVTSRIHLGYISTDVLTVLYIYIPGLSKKYQDNVYGNWAKVSRVNHLAQIYIEFYCACSHLFFIAVIEKKVSRVFSSHHTISSISDNVFSVSVWPSNTFPCNDNRNILQILNLAMFDHLKLKRVLDKKVDADWIIEHIQFEFNLNLYLAICY